MSTTAPQHKLTTPRTRLGRTVAWTFTGLTALLVLALVAVTVVLHSARFHDYLLRTVQRKASDTIGTRSCRT